MNTFQRMRDKLKKISLIALLTGLFAIIFSSKRVNADTTPMTQTSIKDGTSAVSSKLFVTGGGAVKKQVILPDSPKASKKKGMKRAMVSGAIAGTALGLGWFKKEESEMENRKKLFHAIVEPPTSSLPQDEVDVTKQINKFMTEAKEADVKANGEAAKEALITSLKIETITKNMSPSPIIRTYSDTNAYLNSLVNTDAFKAEQVEKAAIEHQRAAEAAEKIAKAKAEQVEKAAIEHQRAAEAAEKIAKAKAEQVEKAAIEHQRAAEAAEKIAKAKAEQVEKAAIEHQRAAEAAEKIAKAKAEQVEKAAIEHQRAAEAAEKIAKATEKAETEAKITELQSEIDGKILNSSVKPEIPPKIIRLVQPLSQENDKTLSEKYAKLPWNERAFQIALDFALVTITPDPDDPDYDSTFDDELASENIFIQSQRSL